MTQANCILACMTPAQIAAAELAVACEISGGDCTAQALQTQADCLLACLSPAQIQAALIVVLCDVANP